MGTRWIDKVKNAKQLTVVPGPVAAANAVWTRVLASALTEFNALSRTHSLGVTLATSKAAPEPGGGGADVMFEVGGGAVVFPFGKGQITVRQIDPNGLEGAAQPIGEPNEGGVQIKKMFIVAPMTPRLGGPSSREVGEGVKLCIAVHELFHACGLNNSDHTLDDIMAGLNADVRTGNTPKDPNDPANDLFVAPNGKAMPPLFVSAQTAGRVQALWKPTSTG